MGVETEVNGGNVRVVLYFVESLLIFVIIGFEADVINLLHTLVFCQSPTKYTT